MESPLNTRPLSPGSKLSISSRLLKGVGPINLDSMIEIACALVHPTNLSAVSPESSASNCGYCTNLSEGLLRINPLILVGGTLNMLGTTHDSNQDRN